MTIGIHTFIRKHMTDGQPSPFTDGPLHPRRAKGNETGKPTNHDDKNIGILASTNLLVDLFFTHTVTKMSYKTSRVVVVTHSEACFMYNQKDFCLRPQKYIYVLGLPFYKILV